MAGFKHRYLIVEIKSKEKRSFEGSLKRILITGLKENYGDWILGKIDYLEICEYYDSLSIAIIRCNLDIYKYLCHTIITTGRLINDKNTKDCDKRIKNHDGSIKINTNKSLLIQMSILSVSGILKKAKVRFLEKIKKDQNAIQL